MPYPAVHQYVSVIGDAFNSTERWQFGFRITDGGVSNEATALAISDDIEDWYRPNLPYGAGNIFNSLATHRLTELKVARIGVDGRYPEGEASYSHFYLPPIAGQTGKPAGMTAQDTTAVTLTTAVPRGLASKGRIYLPPHAQALPDATGLVPAATIEPVLQSMRTLINAINANAVVGNVAIFSRGKGVPSYNADRNRIEYTYPNPGAMNVVTGVAMGRVVDTQRRRRRQLVELPQVAAL